MLPKFHKPKPFQDLKFRPIITNYNSYNYNLSKYLAELLKPFNKSEFCVKDSFQFVENFKNLPNNNYNMFTLDVENLYPSIPVDEAIGYMVELIMKAKITKFSEKTLKRLFEICLKESHFEFEGELFEQINGVSMGSPLSPIVANLFMMKLEEKILESKKNEFVKYFRFVDDCFLLTKESLDKSEEIENWFNLLHPKIKFKIEPEKNNKINFFRCKCNKKKI